jgi:two-component system LytT family response regulator
MLKQYFPEVRVVGTHTDAQSALLQLKHLLPDLLFLDIQMPDLDGFSLLDGLRMHVPEVVFITAYQEYALRAFDVQAAGYLTKPVETQKFVVCMHYVMERIQLKKMAQQRMAGKNIESAKEENKKIILPAGKETLLVHPGEIVYLESRGNYTCIHLADRRQVLVCRQLGQLHQELAAYPLVRAHHRYLVHLGHVARYVSGPQGYVILQNGVMIPVSRRQKERFLEALRCYSHSAEQA